MVRVLVTGVTGLLGRYLVLGRPKGFQVQGISRGNWPRALDDECSVQQVDLTSRDALDEALATLSPDAIVHCAAEGRVDVVQGDPGSFLDINVDVTRQLAEYCSQQGIGFVFVSSNAVFSGDADRPYGDHAGVDPINEYGRLKVLAETAVFDVAPHALVVRPILMYGWPFDGQRRNPVVAWIEALRKGQVIRVVDDVYTEPLAAWDAAAAIWAGLTRGVSGPVNLSGGQEISLFELARRAAFHFDLSDEDIIRVASDAFPGLAPRPRRTSFSLDRLRDELGIAPVGIDDGLRELASTEATLRGSVR